MQSFRNERVMQSVENKVKLILAWVRLVKQYYINALGLNRLCKCLIQQVVRLYFQFSKIWSSCK